VFRLSKLIADGIQNRFSLLGKPAENQHCFGRNCVDYLANLLVVKEQIDELGNFDVVDSDSYFTTRSYDQILLVCLIVHFYVPDRCAINVSFRQRRAAKICPNEHSFVEVRPLKVRPAEVRLADVRPLDQMVLVQLGYVCDQFLILDAGFPFPVEPAEPRQKIVHQYRQHESPRTTKLYDRRQDRRLWPFTALNSWTGSLSIGSVPLWEVSL
jgi:hypothetical protein